MMLWIAARDNMAGRFCGMRELVRKFWSFWTASPILTRWAAPKWSRPVSGKPHLGWSGVSTATGPSRQSKARHSTAS